MENTCRLEKADKMSVRNIFIDKGANFKINDHITEYFLGCRQQRNKTVNLRNAYPKIAY